MQDVDIFGSQKKPHTSKERINDEFVMRITTYGACVLVVYSLNSLSCIVKYGLKSIQYLKGQIVLKIINIVLLWQKYYTN